MKTRMKATLRVLMVVSVFLAGCQATHDVATTSYHVTRGAAVGSYKVARAVAVGSYRVASAPVHYATRKGTDELHRMSPSLANECRQGRLQHRAVLVRRQRSRPRRLVRPALLPRKRISPRQKQYPVNRATSSARSTPKEDTSMSAALRRAPR